MSNGCFTALAVQLENTATLTKTELHHFRGLLHKELHLKMMQHLHLRHVLLPNP